jgi:hypothetical protein
MLEGLAEHQTDETLWIDNLYTQKSRDELAVPDESARDC